MIRPSWVDILRGGRDLIWCLDAGRKLYPAVTDSRPFRRDRERSALKLVEGAVRSFRQVFRGFQERRGQSLFDRAGSRQAEHRGRRHRRDSESISMELVATVDGVKSIN